MATMTIRASFINIPTSAGRKAARRAWGLATRRGDVTSVVEVFSPWAKALFAWLTRRLRLRQYGLWKSPNPIFTDPDVWDRWRSRVHQLHGRGPLRYWLQWPGFNAPRYATVSIYRSIDPTAPLLTVINAHLVPRGPKVPDWWRNQVRKVSIEKITDLTVTHTNAGRVVLLTMDHNMAAPPKIPGVRWVATRSVDAIGIVVPDDVTLSSAEGDTFPAPVDHGHGLVATITITY